MNGESIIERLGFERAIRIDSSTEELSASRAIILEQVKDFGIDEIYFCDDEANNSYPAVFIKRVTNFDTKALNEIANIHRQVWNFKKVLFLYVCNDTEIRIYNCAEKPFIIKKEDTDFEKELKKIEIIRATDSDKERLGELVNVFSSIGIDTGIIWTLDEAESVRKKINLQRRVDKYLVDSLITTAKQLQKDGLNISLIHKIIMRSLFLLYLEDRGATDENFYSQIKFGAKSYFDILNDVTATYLLYNKLEDHFNGNVFTLEEGESINLEQLQLVKKCFVSGNDGIPQAKLFEDWRLFDFSIIQIELLSEIYENFLAEIEPDLKQQTGTYYTPPALVELILNEKVPINNKENIYDVKILDPACGSGIFLVESFKRLVRRYENYHDKKLTDFEELKQLLTNNIFGIELHPQSIKVAAFSLYLTLLDNLNPKTIWQDENKILPNLINNLKDPAIKVQGQNLFCRDTIEDNKEIESIDFDLVVGNPPFGTKELLPSVRQYCDRFGFAKEMVLPFLHKSVSFSPNGEIALIFNTKVLTNTNGSYQNFRHWLFNSCYVEKIFNFSILRNAPKNFGGQLFGSATGPISIVFFRKNEPEFPSDRIVYYAPKTYIKSNVLEGVAIDNSDVKYLPRDECKKRDTKIWKLAMWGGENDFLLIGRLLGINNNVDTFIKKQNIIYGVGLQPLNESTEKPLIDDEIAKLRFLRPERLRRFYTPQGSFSNINSLLKDKKTIEKYLDYYQKRTVDELPLINVFRRLGAKKVYKGPMLLTKEGLKNNKLCFSFIESSVAYNSTMLGFHSEDKDELRLLSAILNSKLSSYFLLMISNSWGIERERIKPNEVYQFPLQLTSEFRERLIELHKQLEQKLDEKEFIHDTTEVEAEIDRIVFESYGILQSEKQLIDDFLNISVDLFLKQNNSKANHAVPANENHGYVTKLCDELNDCLEGQSLFANATTYSINRSSPLMISKISFENQKKDLVKSNENVSDELKKLDQKLWEEKSTNIYFRKWLNYKTGDDIYIIRPNQRRFWTQTMAIEDAAELILEILNEN